MHDPITVSFKHNRAKIKWMYVCMVSLVTQERNVFVLTAEQMERGQLFTRNLVEPSIY